MMNEFSLLNFIEKEKSLKLNFTIMISIENEI